MSIEKNADEPLLLSTAQDGVVTLRLNRPSQFNALSEALLAALKAAAARGSGAGQ